MTHTKKEEGQKGLKVFYYKHVEKNDVTVEIDLLWSKGQIVDSITPDYGMYKIRFYDYAPFYNSILQAIKKAEG